MIRKTTKTVVLSKVKQNACKRTAHNAPIFTIIGPSKEIVLLFGISNQSGTISAQSSSIKNSRISNVMAFSLNIKRDWMYIILNKEKSISKS